MRAILISLLCLFLATCSQSDWNERLSSPDERSFALETISEFRAGDFEALEARMDAELFAETTGGKEEIHSTLPKSGVPELVTVASFSSTASGAVTTTKNLNYEFGSDDRWVIMQISLQGTPDGPSLIGWQVMPFNQRPSSANDFSMGDQGFIGYAWIFTMVFATGIMIVAAVLAFLSKGIRLRWLWILGCLLGLGKFQLNWSSGEWAFQSISLSLLGGAFVKSSPFAPWVLSFSLPIVAICFLATRSRLLASVTEAEHGAGQTETTSSE